MQLDQLKRREFITLVAWPSFGVTYYNLTGHKILFVPSAIGGTCQTDQCAAYNSHTLSGDVRHSRQSTSAEFTAGIGGAADVLAAECNRRKSALRLEMPGAFPSLQRSELMGVDRAYVSGLEKGERNPTIITLWRTAEALGVKLQELTTEHRKSE